MPNKKSKVIVICGPTASGKSDVAIRLAKAIGGEIISADSRQIYKGLNIGSGKVHGAWSMEHGAFLSEGVPHHLIDVANPMEDFNISHFKKLAEEKIEEILSREKIPIICGGTGFWIDSVVKNSMIPEVVPNEELRNMLRSKSEEELFQELQKLDPERAKNIDAKNKVRLIRALEIVEKLGVVPALQDAENTKYDFLQIGLDVPKEILHEKIKKRLDERFEEGMIEEVEGLMNPPSGGGVNPEWLERIGLEYRWISRYLQNKVTLEEMKEKLYFDIIHYAKRQMTWFRRNKNIIWLKDYAEIEKTAKKFLQ